MHIQNDMHNLSNSDQYSQIEKCKKIIKARKATKYSLVFLFFIAIISIVAYALALVLDKKIVPSPAGKPHYKAFTSRPIIDALFLTMIIILSLFFIFFIASIVLLTITRSNSQKLISLKKIAYNEAIQTAIKKPELVIKSAAAENEYHLEQKEEKLQVSETKKNIHALRAKMSVPIAPDIQKFIDKNSPTRPKTSSIILDSFANLKYAMQTGNLALESMEKKNDSAANPNNGMHTPLYYLFTFFFLLYLSDEEERKDIITSFNNVCSNAYNHVKYEISTTLLSTFENKQTILDTLIELSQEKGLKGAIITFSIKEGQKNILNTDLILLQTSLRPNIVLNINQSKTANHVIDIAFNNECTIMGKINTKSNTFEIDCYKNQKLAVSHDEKSAIIETKEREYVIYSTKRLTQEDVRCLRAKLQKAQKHKYKAYIEHVSTFTTRLSQFIIAKKSNEDIKKMPEHKNSPSNDTRSEIIENLTSESKHFMNKQILISLKITTTQIFKMEKPPKSDIVNKELKDESSFIPSKKERLYISVYSLDEKNRLIKKYNAEFMPASILKKTIIAPMNTKQLNNPMLHQEQYTSPKPLNSPLKRTVKSASALNEKLYSHDGKNVPYLTSPEHKDTSTQMIKTQHQTRSAATQNRPRTLMSSTKSMPVIKEHNHHAY